MQTDCLYMASRGLRGRLIECVRPLVRFDNDYAKEDDKVDVYGEDHLDEDEYTDQSQVSGDVKVDVIGNRSTVISFHDNGRQDEERDKSPQRTLSGGYHSGSKGNSSTENIVSPYEMRM